MFFAISLLSLFTSIMVNGQETSPVSVFENDKSERVLFSTIFPRNFKEDTSGSKRRGSLFLFDMHRDLTGKDNLLQKLPESCNNFVLLESLAGDRFMKEMQGEMLFFSMLDRGNSQIEANVPSNRINESTLPDVGSIDRNTRAVPPPVDIRRFQHLSKSDLETYYLIDSLIREEREIARINFQKNLVDGYLPMGLVKLELSKLLGFNQFEGLRFGLGVWTSEEVSDRFSTGGYYTRSIKSRNNNYGAGIKFKLGKKSGNELDLRWDNSFSATGSFSFLDGYARVSPERFKHLIPTTMDRVNSISTSLRNWLFQDFKGEFSYRYSSVTPVVIYPFFTGESNVQEGYTSNQYVIKLRWERTKCLTGDRVGTAPIKTGYPVVWANVTMGNGHMIEPFSYKKLEGQIEKSFRTSTFSRAVSRVTAGNIFGSYPASKLYSSHGTNRPGVGIETPFTFATMHPNEFATSRFISVFIRNTFFTRLNASGNFKPEITVSSSFGIGDVKSIHGVSNIRTINNGFYESGLYIGNLFRNLIFKHGFAVHYRYGPYKLPGEIDNWSFKIGLEIDL